MGGGSGRDPFFHDKSLAKTKAFPVVVSMLCPRRAVWAWTLPLGMAVTLVLSVPQIDLMPHDLVTQLLRVLAIETKQEKALVHADPTELTLSGLEAFSFDYVVKWPLSLIINRWAPVPGALASAGSCLGLSGRKGRACALSRGSLHQSCPMGSPTAWQAGHRTAPVASQPGRCLVPATTASCHPVPRRKALTRYQMLFRHLFYCKHVERQLCNVWVSNKTAKQRSLHSARWCVRARPPLRRPRFGDARHGHASRGSASCR